MELRVGYKMVIAENVRCAPSTVTDVLNGKRSQKTSLGKAIVKMAKACERSERNLDQTLKHIRETINKN